MEYHGSLATLADPGGMERLLDQSVRNDWVVCAKRPVAGPRKLSDYLGRYTRRVAI